MARSEIITLRLPLGVHLRPLTGLRVVGSAVVTVQRGDLRYQRIVRIRVGQKAQDAQEYLRDRQRRAPVVLENVQADAARCVDVGMVDLRPERDDRRLEGIVAGKSDRHVKDSTAVRRIRRAEDHGLPVEEIRLAHRTGRTVRRRVLLNLLVFTLKSAQRHRACDGAASTGRSSLLGWRYDRQPSRYHSANRLDPRPQIAERRCPHLGPLSSASVRNNGDRSAPSQSL